MEPISGLEPETSSLPRKCSTAELYGQSCYSAASQLPAITAAALRPRRSHKYVPCATVTYTARPLLALYIFSAYSGAGDRDRTDIISLEGWGSTIELHPHIALNFWWRG
jgi:hypothetical protein